MNPEKSLEIIQSMMAESKQSFQRVSPYFIIWGVLLTISGLAEHIIVYQMGRKEGYAVWILIGITGGIWSFLASRKHDRLSAVKSFYDHLHSYLWGSFGVTMFLLIFFSVYKGLNPTPFVLLLTGMPTFATGGLIRFKPLIVGGLVFWLAGIIAFFIPNEYTGLLFSLAILLGYVAPGLLLKKEEAKNNA